MLNTSQLPTLYSLPGWQNSGPEHWQSLWEVSPPACVAKLHRVEQAHWDTPVLQDWIYGLEQVLSQAQQGCAIVTHSLGGILLAHWAAHSAKTTEHVFKIKAALIVAPPCQDAILNDLPAAAVGFAQVPLQTLPFCCTVISSTDDPFDMPLQARQYASAWGAEFTLLPAKGHINASSGLGLWSQGQDMIQAMMQ